MFHVEHLPALQRGLKQIFPLFEPLVLDQFSVYQRLLLEWNNRMNLISRRDESRIEERHFLESVGFLTAAHFPQGCRVADIGSGAGFPGLPVKLVRPDLTMTLIEAKRKKVLFLRHLCEVLELKGIEVVAGRVETAGRDHGPFDMLISRSVTDLATLVGWTRGCWRKGAGFVVLKGASVYREAEALEQGFSKKTVASVQVRRFDPFPDIAPREGSFMAVIELGADGAYRGQGPRPDRDVDGMEQG